jgi:hypothetical protein
MAGCRGGIHTTAKHRLNSIKHQSPYRLAAPWTPGRRRRSRGLGACACPPAGPRSLPQGPSVGCIWAMLGRTRRCWLLKAKWTLGVLLSRHPLSASEPQQTTFVEKLDKTSTSPSSSGTPAHSIFVLNPHLCSPTLLFPRCHPVPRWRRLSIPWFSPLGYRFTLSARVLRLCSRTLSPDPNNFRIPLDGRTRTVQHTDLSQPAFLCACSAHCSVKAQLSQPNILLPPV